MPEIVFFGLMFVAGPSLEQNDATKNIQQQQRFDSTATAKDWWIRYLQGHVAFEKLPPTKLQVNLLSFSLFLLFAYSMFVADFLSSVLIFLIF